MIISYHFGISVEEYAQRGRENEFPVFHQCPNCHCIGHGNVHRHGFYERFVVTEEITVKILICRWKCLNCGVNLSVLPDFLIPYFQYSLRTILMRVKQLLEKKQSCASGRQLLHFHLKRYIKNLQWVHSMFVELGQVEGFSKDRQREATKYLKRILDFGESPFLRRSWGHLSRYFMAN